MATAPTATPIPISSHSTYGTPVRQAIPVQVLAGGHPVGPTPSSLGSYQPLGPTRGVSRTIAPVVRRIVVTGDQTVVQVSTTGVGVQGRANSGQAAVGVSTPAVMAYAPHAYTIAAPVSTATAAVATPAATATTATTSTASTSSAAATTAAAATSEGYSLGLPVAPSTMHAAAAAVPATAVADRGAHAGVSTSVAAISTAATAAMAAKAAGVGTRPGLAQSSSQDLNHQSASPPQKKSSTTRLQSPKSRAKQPPSRPQSPAAAPAAASVGAASSSSSPKSPTKHSTMAAKLPKQPSPGHKSLGKSSSGTSSPSPSPKAQRVRLSPTVPPQQGTSPAAYPPQAPPPQGSFPTAASLERGTAPTEAARQQRTTSSAPRMASASASAAAAAAAAPTEGPKPIEAEGGDAGGGPSPPEVAAFSGSGSGSGSAWCSFPAASPPTLPDAAVWPSSLQEASTVVAELSPTQQQLPSSSPTTERPEGAEGGGENMSDHYEQLSPTSQGPYEDPTSSEKEGAREVMDFLASVNLDQYAGDLLRNGFDEMETLCLIEANDLKDLGVPRGHTLKLLKRLREYELEVAAMGFEEALGVRSWSGGCSLATAAGPYLVNSAEASSTSSSLPPWTGPGPRPVRSVSASSSVVNSYVGRGGTGRRSTAGATGGLAGNMEAAPLPSDHLKDAVERSWERVQVVGSYAVAELLYRHTFELEPATMALFPTHVRHKYREWSADETQDEDIWVDAALKKLFSKFVNAIGCTVAGIRDRQRMIPLLTKLGARHINYKVREDHWQIMGVALDRTLSDILHEEYTEDVRNAWTAVYKFMADTMIAGLRQAQAQRAAKFDSGSGRSVNGSVAEDEPT